MVSPSKIFKTSTNAFNFGIVSSKKNGLRTHGASKERASSTSESAHSRLLSNTRFYLDIRNRIQLDKVETILKSYGAKIEIFFRKDIKVIVTDKAEWMGSGYSTSSSVSPLTTPSPSTNQDQRFAVPKSRATAMLEKVSKQPASSYSSPLELAQKWRIPILSVRSLWKWIAKVEEAYITEFNDKKREKLLENKIVVCARDKAPFIKIESIVSRNLPEFLELEAWPNLNLDGCLGQCPFRFPSPPSPPLSDENPEEVKNKLFEVKDKVAVELIQYDTDFRIKDNIKLGECEEEEEGEKVEVSENQNRSSFSLSRNNAIINEDDASKITDPKHSLSPLCNGYGNRSITRQSSQELLKVQCNGLNTSHRNSKLLSPSGSDVLPLPSSRRSTRRASASWCGSTRELSQLSPTDSEIENIRRSDSSFEAHDPALDSPGITLRPKGQLWLPIALIGTTAEENGNCIRKRYEYCIRQSENAKLSSDLLDSFDEKPLDECDINDMMPKVSKESDSSLNSNFSQNEYLVKKNVEKKDTYCIVTRNTKVKNEEINGRSRESSVESHKSDKDQSKSRVECKKRSLSVCGRVSPIVKRTRTMSTNSVHSVGRKKKLSPEEKLLQDNKEYFKMEVLNTKLRSTGSLLSVNINKDSEVNASNAKSIEKINKIIIKKIKIRRKRKRSKRTKARNKKSNESNFTTVIIENKKNVNVKINGVIRKKRQSELMKLCNEAESFMFGESSRQGCIATNATESESEEFSRKKKNSLPSIKANIIEEISTDSNCENEGKRRKKRRSHAEAFIHDNLDYYKFETPGSRLRYQGSFLDIKSEDKDFIYTLKHKKKEISKRNEVSGKLHLHVEVKEEKTEGQEKKRNSIIPSAEIEKILFSFESIPVTEPWYEVYKRQDEGLENYYPLLSNPNDQPFLLPYELPKPTYSKAPSVSEYYKRRRKKLVHLFNHPRKSPRCHASTLAILSSLKKRKRRSGTNISMNSLLSESPTNNLNASEEKFEVRQLERGKNELEDEEILDFLYNNQSDAEDNEIMLEPLSDCESKSTWKNSDSSRSVKSDEEETKNIKTGYRGKKLTKMDSTFEPDVSNEECKYFLWQTINPDDFFKDMVIETQKKSGLVVNIATILEHYKNCKSMEDSDDNLISKINMGCATEISEKNIKRKKKKARKINKTGWDNRKSRRRTGNRIDVKEVGCSEVKENRIKTTIKVREEGVNSSSIINSSKRRMKREVVNKNQEREDRPVLRSHLEISDNAVGLRHNSQDNETRSDVPNILDSSAQEYPSYVLRMKKLVDSGTNSNMRLRCSNGRYTLQKRRLILNRKKKRVVDYAWTTKKR